MAGEASSIAVDRDVDLAIDLTTVSRLTEPEAWAELGARQRSAVFETTRTALWELRWEIEQRAPTELGIIDTLIVLVDEWGGDGPLPDAVQGAARTMLLRAQLPKRDEMTSSGIRPRDDFTAIPTLLDALSKKPGVFGAFVMDHSGELMAAAGDRASLDVVAAVGTSREARRTELPRRLRLMGRRHVELTHGKVVLLVVLQPHVQLQTLHLEDVALESAMIFERLLQRLDAWADPTEFGDLDDRYKD